MLALFLLTLFFLDEKIQWYEAMSLFIVYIIYGIAISHDEKLEKNFKFLLYKVTQVSACYELCFRSKFDFNQLLFEANIFYSKFLYASFPAFMPVSFK